MPGDSKLKKAIPHCLNFVTCMGILEHAPTHTFQLFNPIHHVPIRQFPERFVMSLWLQLTDGHGEYDAQLCLLDAEENVVWKWDTLPPIMVHHPLFPETYSMKDFVLEIPRAGRYYLVLLLNGQEAAQRSLWFGPEEMFLQE